MNNRNNENTILINKVIKFIEQNIDQDLPLEKLARQVNYSPFHFQRIFKSVVGETPKQYIKRLRLEGASHFIVLKPKTSLLEVALMFGFTSLESFSRAFKNYYNLSPNEFRKSNEEEKLAVIQEKTKSDAHNAIEPASFLSKYIDPDSGKLEIEVVKLPARKLVYIPVTFKDVETVVSGYKRIKQWANARELIKPNTEIFGLMRDYPLFTSLDKCRFFTCVSVDAEPKVTAEVHYLEIPSRTYATFKVSGEINELIKSITKFANLWLPESGYEIFHESAIMVPLNDPFTTPLHDITYQFYLAIKPK